MALTLVSLVEGYVDEHLHSFETSFYVLEGEPVLYLERRGVTLEPGACGAISVGAPHARVHSPATRIAVRLVRR